MGISKITRNCQITLPKDVRKIVGFKEGDEVVITAINGGAMVTRSDRDFVKEAAGIWNDLKKTRVEYERRIRKGWRKRIVREYATPGH